jgi:hypothetical protein
VALQDGAALKLFINDSPVTLVTQLSRVTETGIVRIETLEGLAGFTNGSGAVTITFNYPIMIGGSEYDYHGMAARKEYVKFQMFEGAQSYAGLGKLEKVESSQSTGAASEGNLSWTGELKAPE